MKIQVGIKCLHEEAYLAVALIDKLLNINKINRNITISYDFMSKFGGYHFPTIETDTIFINPDNCAKIEEYDVNNTSKDNLYYPGYCADNTIFGIIIHEFAHFLHCQVYRHLLDNYKKEFPHKRLMLWWYSNNVIDDELANAITLYMTNPYLLKLVSSQHYNFFKKQFKSPTSSTKYRCSEIYSNFPIQIKNDLKHRWGIIYNVETNNFKQIEVESNIKENNEV